MSNPQRVELRHGDCIELMRQLPDNSIDSIVTDPPYGLEFMGKEWDSPSQMIGAVSTLHGGLGRYKKGEKRTGYAQQMPEQFQVFSRSWAAESLRVLKPGGHLLAFGGTRTYHRLAVAIEDAGFEIRDSLIWLYGSGFPKSHDVSKAIDKAVGAEREVIGQTKANGIKAITKTRVEQGYRKNLTVANEREIRDITAPATPAAQQWSGWGTALKPAHEPIVVARKPLIGTVAENVLEWGVGAMNIDGCRIGYSNESDSRVGTTALANGFSQGDVNFGINPKGKNVLMYKANGRWPANVVLSHTVFCDDTCAEGCPVAELDRQSGNIKGGTWNQTDGARMFDNDGKPTNYKTQMQDKSVGGASRFFYVAKASKRERPKVDGVAHPTVKPLALMRWLVRLVTPPNGTVLEPFAGSGTTVEAALLEGFSVLAFEKTADYLPLIRERIRRTDTGVTN